MGAWSVDAFGNDDAADWAHDLEDADDLGPIEEAFASVLEAGDEYLEAPQASVALAAVEALARLMGRTGEKSAYTEAVDNWVAKATAKPTTGLIDKAQVVVSRILADDSELKELWQDSDDYAAWLASVSDLRARVGA